MPEDRETWKNATEGRIGVQKFDARGQLEPELVGPGRNVLVTPQERAINQEMAADADLDVFANGHLQPVRLLEGDETAEIANNPNFLSESEMRSLIKGHWRTFDTRVGAVSNPAVLDRLLVIAHEEDATVRQVERIIARKEELSPNVVTEVTQVGDQAPRETIRPVTPR